MSTSRWSSRVCDDPFLQSMSTRRFAAVTLAAIGLAVAGAAPSDAANNPGTGDSGFFTFRPSSAVGGTQINVASGNALVRTRDLADSNTNYHVVVDRAYNSLAPDTFAILSSRWAFDAGPTNGLAVESNQDVTVTGPSGYKIRFARQNDGTYTPPAGFDGSLTKTSSGWTLARTSQNDQFGYDNNGKLAWTRDAAAHDFTVQGTSAAGRDVLSSYGTSSGRRVNLSYSGDSLVREMDDPSSGHHYYRYTNGRLSQYEVPDDAITAYRYDGNGRLDKITEPGGRTVELSTTAGGRVSSITSTLPGGIPQTTSFAYTRRPYKTDVTGPDGVRRTYAYDDDYRVTRQYNPDVKPNVTAAGELFDRAGKYVKGDRAYHVVISADEPDGAGLTHLGLDGGGTEIAGTNPACSDTSFDHVCPTAYEA
jgi:YD repeat-containing protein